MTGWSIEEGITQAAVNETFERFIAGAVAQRAHAIEAQREEMRTGLTLFLMNLGLSIIGDVDSGVTAGRHSAVWAEATVFLHEDYRPEKGWEPEIEPLCWKAAVRQSGEYGFYNGLTVRGWHRASYKDTIYVDRADDDPSLLALAMARVVAGDCETDAEVDERQKAAAADPADQLVAALQRVLRRY